MNGQMIEELKAAMQKEKALSVSPPITPNPEPHGTGFFIAYRFGKNYILTLFPPL
ncbi:MAG: hypothetical protein RIR39_1323 [Pseudomonadota bacterium]|jgi:hypothetical protein